ncbi:sulfite exporter TauE/SafE family protein [bacterium]|nr:sulfite exporter TauE/SafE family protein [bacterium]
MEYLGFALIGAVAGILSGFVGVGGGLIIIPALVLFFGYDQLKAQGTSLAVLLPPIGILGFWQYWKNPEVEINLWGAGIVALMLMLGAYFGAKWANVIDPLLVRKCFAGLMMVSAVYLFFKH